MAHLFDHPLISERYFFPRPGQVIDETRVELEGCTLSNHHSERDPEAPTVLYFHGNGEIVADYVPGLRDVFHDMGANAYFAEYRGYGASTGRPLMATMLDDVSAIIEQSGIPPEKLIVFGRSVGSIYALEAAKRYPNIAGLIIESGISDPVQRIELRVTPEELGTSAEELHEEAKRLFNHEEKLGHYKGPLLILHARQDHLVTLDHAEDNYPWSASPQKELVIFEKGDHNSILFMNQLQYLQKVAEFIALTKQNS